MHKSMVTTFIGAGNMASSLIGGLIADGYDPKKIWVSDPTEEKLNALHKRFGIHVTQNNLEAAKRAEILVLAVKPQILKVVVSELAPIIQQHKPLVISIAAMISTAHLEKWIGNSPAIVRCMPNTPALLGCGATGLFANASVTQEQKNLAESILRAVGITVWVDDENLMEVITVLSGCGPAYFFLLMETLQEIAEKMGLAKEPARLLTLQTALGAARMALENAEDVAILRKRVASPGGTTEYALKILEEGKFRQLFFEALTAAKQRSIEMAEKTFKD